MKYFAIFDKNVATIFQLQWKIRNISDMFLQYSVVYGIVIFLYILYWRIVKNIALGVKFYISVCIFYSAAG